MKQDDLLKKFINQNRESFDNEALPAGLYGRILKNTVQRRRTRRRKIAWVAAVAGLIVLLYTFQIPSEPSRTIEPEQIATTEPAENPSAQNQPLRVETQEDEPAGKSGHEQQPQEKWFAKHTVTADLKIHRLRGNESVSQKIEAILEASAAQHSSERVVKQLGQLFLQDQNSNVRLAALNALANNLNQKGVRDFLIEGLEGERDPMIQLELVRILGEDRDPAVTENLVKMASVPFTVREVKEQIYYTLLARSDPQTNF